MSSYFLSVLGFIGTVCVVFGPLIGACFFAFSFLFSPRIKAKMQTVALGGAGIFLLGIALIVFTLFLFPMATQNTDEDVEDFQEDLEEVSDRAQDFYESQEEEADVVVRAGMNSGSCNLEDMETEGEYVLFSFWLETNEDVTVEDYAMNLTYDLGEGELEGYFTLRAYGDEDPLASTDPVLMSGQGEDDLDSVESEFVFQNSNAEEGSDGIYEVVFVPTEMSSLGQGENTLTVQLPVIKWDFSKAQKSLISSTSTAVSVDGALRVTCSL